MSGNDSIIGDGILGTIANMMTAGLGPNAPIIVEPPPAPGPFFTDIDFSSGMIIEGPIPVAQTLSGLDAQVQLGLFRYAELKYDDELGIALHLSVHSGETGSSTDEDWLVASGEEDWLTDTGADEDWGFGVVSSDQYDVNLIGTNNGFTSFTGEDLINLIVPSEQLNRYACYSCGQFFIVDISAIEYPKMFRLAALEISGTKAGRL